MSFPIPDAIALIRSALLLLKEEPTILASPEAAAYFRTRRALPPPLLPVPHAKSAPPPKPEPRPEAPVENLTCYSEKIKSETPYPEELKLKADALQEQKTSPQIQRALITSSARISAEREAPDVATFNESIAEGSMEEKSRKLVQDVSKPLQGEPRGKDSRPVSQFQSILKKIAPELAILDTIPDDSAAKQIASRWKTKNRSAPISVLSSGELPPHTAFLTEIATALDVHFGPARLIEADSIEKEKQWKTFLSVGSLKLIVVCDSTLWQLHHLRQFYKETPATGVRMLGEVPIFLLPDLSLYLKDPLLKRSLWKALCSRLS